MEVCIDNIVKDNTKYKGIPEGSKIAIENDYYL
jgi:hypothetical protein